MKCFDILGISDFSSKEKVEKAYNERIEQLSSDKEIFSSELFEKKYDELNQAKSDCLDYIDKSFSDKIVAQAKNGISMRTNRSILYSDACCISSEGICCYSWGEFGGTLCCILFVGAIGLYSNPYIIDDCDCCHKSPEYEENRLARKKAREQAKNMRIAEEQNRKKLEKEKAEREKLIKQKTKELKKETKYINKDISRYNELCNKTSCTADKINLNLTLIQLFSLIDAEYDRTLNKALEPYKKIAFEKAIIEEKVKKTAQLYRDIGNYNAANELMGRLNK